MTIEYTRENLNRITKKLISAREYVRANRDVLREVYQNNFIAILNGVVIDNDENCVRLWRRVSEDSWKRGEVDKYPVISTVGALTAKIEGSFLEETLFGGI